MKTIVRSLTIAAMLGLPLSALAAGGDTITRTQAKQELARLEKAGYDPAGSSNDYPVALRAAEARVAQQNAATAQSYGGKPDCSSESGVR